MTHRSDIAEDKQRLRTAARMARADIEPGLRARLAEDASKLLLSLEEVRSARVVLAYAASTEELDPASACARLRELGATVAMPRMEGPGELAACSVTDDELEAGPFGIRQPCKEAPTLDLASIDVVIVPGVVFDTGGGRIGYGGGFYDRLLPKLRPGCFAVGFAFDEQVVANVPVAEHDRRVNALVTPTHIVRFGA